MKYTLKEKFWDVMLIAQSMDGNEQIYPIAFGFDNGVNDWPWAWFLTELHNVTRSPKLDDYFRSHININNDIRKMFPLASHDLCEFHKKQNVKNRFKNEKVTAIFDHASKVYRKSDFDNQMKKL